MRTYHLRMRDDYGWTLGKVSPDAPNNSAVLTVERDGTRWVSQVNVDRLSIADLSALAEFCAHAKLDTGRGT